MELAFAGLHQLCGPMLSRADSLPEPQRDALRTAFALASRSRSVRGPGAGLAVARGITGPAAGRLKPWPARSASTPECPLRLVYRAGRQERR
jgi:hypothetical protein